jgi:hypothetical protein
MSGWFFLHEHSGVLYAEKGNSGMLSTRLPCPTKRHLKSGDAFKMNKIELFELKTGGVEEKKQGVSQPRCRRLSMIES